MPAETRINEPPKISSVRTLLLIDGNPAHAAVFDAGLLSATDGPFNGECVSTLAAGLERLKKQPMWAVFASLSLSDSHGLATVDQLLLEAPGVPMLVLAAAEDEAIGLEALRRGAKDYLLENRFDNYSCVRAIRNMAERKAAEEALFTERERAQVTLNSIGDAVLSTDVTGKVTYLNVVAETMLGWTRREAAGKPLDEVFKIVDGTTRTECINPLKVAIEKDKTVSLTPHCILIRRDGREFAIEDSAAPIHDRHGAITGAVIVFHDVSVQRAMRIEMAHLAEHDILTNLPNRTLLMDRLSKAIDACRRNGTRLAVQFLDLDGFKHINDSLGHKVGDKLLQAVAKRLLACVRVSDTVSRQGGDEFVLILSEISHAQDAGVKAGKILNSLTAPYNIDEHQIQLTASVGVTTYPDDGLNAEILIKNADMAMYQAKQKGRNNCQFFERSMNVRALERQSVEDSLRCALERDQLVLHYQPKVNLKTGDITGVEALVRWQHPDRGLIGPLNFISIAEDCGLMLPIGQWVLRESCTQAQQWRDAGFPVEIAVNISAAEFRSEDFLQSVQTILEDTHLEPRFLELELTESVLMQHAEFTAPMLQRLKIMGVRLAIDDFGTGFSSLSYLRQFPIDTLKVDQSFVHEIDTDTDDATIIHAVINMSKGLNHRVIAEGVETAQQLAFLRHHGCDEGQGYYLGKPMPEAQLAKFLETGIPVDIRQDFLRSSKQGASTSVVPCAAASHVSGEIQFTEEESIALSALAVGKNRKTIRVLLQIDAAGLQRIMRELQRKTKSDSHASLLVWALRRGKNPDQRTEERPDRYIPAAIVRDFPAGRRPKPVG